MSAGRLTRIVSGGQTGVDRGALDAALALGMPVGGWCPRGRRAEDGAIPERYPLRETPHADYRERTDWNVRDSDATLIIAKRPLSGGTRFTLDCARRHGRPCHVADPDDPEALDETLAWLAMSTVAVLNIAGPRESGAPGAGQRAAAFVAALLERARAGGNDL
ncbi:MAG: putative molybdenum carrier protein [Gammaproteobacteria bacterium]|jgi:hypothetical protein